METSDSDCNEDKKSLPVKSKFPKIQLIPKRIKYLKKAEILRRILRRKKKKNGVKLNQRTLACEKCGKRFATWWEIREHWVSTEHKAPQQCRWCKKKTFTLQSHLCKKHWNIASTCPYCGQLFMFQEDQKKHLQFHDGSEYCCFLCGRQKKNEELLQNHMLNHYVYDKYGCNVCEKRFKKKKSMENHLKLIHFICQYCGKNCEDREDLRTHVKNHDDLVCVFCRKTFSQKNRLKYHYQLKHGHQDFYKCTLCFQRFSMRSRLLNHLKLKHKGISKYSCDVCAAPFLYWQQYINHFENTHAKLHDDTVFSCSSCDFVTDLKVKLKWHVEKTSRYGFFCKKCQLSLQCKGMFDKHMEMHKKDNVWTCDYCPRSYSSDNSLRHHVAVGHREIMISQNPCGYPCLQLGCDKYYATASSLARHLRKTHCESSVSISTSESYPRLTGKDSQNSPNQKSNNTFHKKVDLCDIDKPENEKGNSETHEKKTRTTSEKESTTDEESNLSEKPAAESILEKKCHESKIANKLSGEKNAITNEKNFSFPSDKAELSAGKSQKKASRKRKFLSKDSDEESILTNSENEASNSKLSIAEVRSTSKGYHHVLEDPLETIEVDVFSCSECDKIWFSGEVSFEKHMAKHENMTWEEECILCSKSLESSRDAVEHIVKDHLKVGFL